MQIDFYILSTPQQRSLFTCRLAEKIYRLGQRAYIHTADAQQASGIDTLLWTFQSGSFVPHDYCADSALAALETSASSAYSPIVIGHSAAPPCNADVLINATDELAGFYSQFPRVAEIVDGAEQAKLKARDRFRFYRDGGHSVATHMIDNISP